MRFLLPLLNPRCHIDTNSASPLLLAHWCVPTDILQRYAAQHMQERASSGKPLYSHDASDCMEVSALVLHACVYFGPKSCVFLRGDMPHGYSSISRGPSRSLIPSADEVLSAPMSVGNLATIGQRFEKFSTPGELLRCIKRQPVRRS